MRLPYLFLISAVLIVSAVFVSGCTSEWLSGLPFISPVPTTSIPANTTCGMENCHGLLVRCGAQPVNFCTTEYVPGDRCRQFASCHIVQGSCQLALDPAFERCKNCVEMCSGQYGNNQMAMMTCEQKC